MHIVLKLAFFSYHLLGGLPMLVHVDLPHFFLILLMQKKIFFVKVPELQMILDRVYHK